MFYFRKIVLTTLAFLITFCADAQVYNFRNYTVDDGLAFIYVYTIYQDEDGYLWSGSYGGLSRFDGKTFVNYTTKDGLLNNWVTSITEDKTGKLWVGTIKGVSVLAEGKFKNYSTKDGLAGERVNSVVTGENGDIYIATSKGLTIYSKGKFTSLETGEGLPSTNVKTLITGKNKSELWIGTDNGIGFYDGISFKNYSEKDGIPDKHINTLALDGNGNLWIGTDNGLSLFDGKTFKNYSTSDGLPSVKITALIFDVKGNLWIGTDKEICRHDGKNFKTYYIRGKIANTNVQSLYSDYEGNIWIGTNNALYRFRGESFTTFTTAEGLNNTFIFQILRDSQNNLWIGTDGGGLNKYADGKFSAYTIKDGLPANKINAGIIDTEGGMWFATGGGLCTFDGKTFTVVDHNGTGKKEEVFSVFQDSRKNIWIGTENTIYRFDGKSWEKIPLISKADKIQPWAIKEDKKGNMWIGTYLGGLFYYDGEKMKDMTSLIGKNSDSYLSIEVDDNDVMYVATLEGVFAYDGTTVTQFSMDDGMSSDRVYLLHFDDGQNSLWAGTNQGVNKINLAEFRKTGKKSVVPYGKEDGFLGVESNTNGAWRDADGTFWFGTVNGLIKYTPGEFILNTAESKTTIRGFQLFYNDTVLPQNADLPYYMNNISFEYIGICLTNPDKVKYSYMLEEFDNKWSPETKNGIARYPNLPPGNYTFMVKSCNNEGKWNEKAATFSFTIATPWWKTWTFATVFVLFLAGLVLLGVRIRIRQVEVNERNKVRLANNELKALRSQMNPHFIFNALNSIQHFIMNSDESGASKYLNKFAKLIRSILNNTEKSTVTLQEEVDSLKLYLELEVLRFENKFDYEIKVDAGTDLAFYEVPTLLIQPYVENAIIHGLIPKKTKGRLDINIKVEEKFIVCTIDDDGIGRKRSMEMKEKSMKKGHQSFGMKITRDRLELLNSVHNSSLSVNITDKEDEYKNPLGTHVEIFIPIV